MVAFYKIWKKYNEIELTKNKMDKQSKNEKSSTLSCQFLLEQDYILQFAK